MRMIMLVIGILCMFAQVAEAREPFGVPVRSYDGELRGLRDELRRSAEIQKIADKLRGLKGLALLGWVNQSVQMSSVIGTDNLCTTKTLAKCEVLRLVDPRLQCRPVEGTTRASVLRAGILETHLMATVQLGAVWHVLDNRHIVYGYYTPTDKEVAAFSGTRKFNAFRSYKE